MTQLVRLRHLTHFLYVRWHTWTKVTHYNSPVLVCHLTGKNESNVSALHTHSLWCFLCTVTHWLTCFISYIIFEHCKENVHFKHFFLNYFSLQVSFYFDNSIYVVDESKTTLTYKVKREGIFRTSQSVGMITNVYRPFSLFSNFALRSAIIRLTRTGLVGAFHLG